VSRLLGPNGQPITMSEFKKADAPPTGPAFGHWVEQEYGSVFTNPGAAVLGFDVNSLTIADYRAMRHHPQVNASLSVLTFILHQIDWHIECKDQKIANQVEANVRDIWTRLIRALSQSFWCGYAPNVLEFENNNQDDELDIIISKVKDLRPESCKVHWRLVEAEGRPPRPDDTAGSTGVFPMTPMSPPVGGPAPGTNRMRHKFKVYDGIDQHGFGWIPPENTLWYPRLMENGDYSGKKLLNACYMPWYFSILIHLFANRYYERFGEPVPVGRAPFDDEVTINGSVMSGRDAMQQILMNLRNRSTVTLPSDTDPVNKEKLWDIEYLESAMRGGDFENYLTRLDEEISLGLFTPLLMMKNSSVGSQNLGIQHTQTYLWMLNALASDVGEYITRYVTERLKAINFSPNAPTCKWVPNKMGKDSAETTRAVVVELIKAGKIKPDLEELGQALGMDLTEVRQVLAPEGDPNAAPAGDPRTGAGRPERIRGVDGPQRVGEARATTRAVSARIRNQVTNAFKKDIPLVVDLGFNKRFSKALDADGLGDVADIITEEFYQGMMDWFDKVAPLMKSDFESPRDFMAMVDRKLDSTLDDLVLQHGI
jgi:hypothetical protein